MLIDIEDNKVTINIKFIFFIFFVFIFIIFEYNVCIYEIENMGDISNRAEIIIILILFRINMFIAIIFIMNDNDGGTLDRDNIGRIIFFDIFEFICFVEGCIYFIIIKIIIEYIIIYSMDDIID